MLSWRFCPCPLQLKVVAPVFECKCSGNNVSLSGRLLKHRFTVKIRVTAFKKMWKNVVHILSNVMCMDSVLFIVQRWHSVNHFQSLQQEQKWLTQGFYFLGPVLRNVFINELPDFGMIKTDPVEQKTCLFLDELAWMSVLYIAAHI